MDAKKKFREAMSAIKIHVDIDCPDPTCTKTHQVDVSALDVVNEVIRQQEQDAIQNEFTGVDLMTYDLARIFHANHTYRVKNRDEVNAKLKEMRDAWWALNDELAKQEEAEEANDYPQIIPIARA